MGVPGQRKAASILYLAMYSLSGLRLPRANTESAKSDDHRSALYFKTGHRTCLYFQQ